jgi:hypothetical protein
MCAAPAGERDVDQVLAVTVRFGQPLPPICVFCGDRAESVRIVSFRDADADGDDPWAPLAFYILGPLVLLPRLIAVFLPWVSPSGTLRLPICHGHRNWRWRSLQIAGVAMVPPLAGLSWLLLSPWPIVQQGQLCLLGILWISLVLVLLVRRNPIRAQRTGLTTVDLWGVAPQFARALREMPRPKSDQGGEFLDWIKRS